MLATWPVAGPRVLMDLLSRDLHACARERHEEGTSVSPKVTGTGALCQVSKADFRVPRALVQGSTHQIRAQESASGVGGESTVECMILCM